MDKENITQDEDETCKEIVTSDFRDKIYKLLTDFSNLSSETFQPTLEFLTKSKCERLFNHLMLVLSKTAIKQFEQAFPTLFAKVQILDKLIKSNPKDQIQWRPTGNPRVHMRASFIKSKQKYISELTMLVENKRESVQKMKETVIKQRKKYQELENNLNAMAENVENNHNYITKLIFSLKNTYKSNLTLHH